MAHKPTYYRNPKYVAPQLILGGIEFIICLLSLCYSCYIYASKRKKGSLSKSLKLMNSFGITAFLFCGIVQSVNIYFYNTYYWKYSSQQTISWYLTWFCWSSGQIMSYLLFLNRIKSSFSNSTYEPTKLTLIYLYILLTAYILLWIIANFVPFGLYTHHFTRNALFEIEFYLSIPITFIDIIITLSMTYIFVSRLYKLILTQSSMNYKESIENHLLYSPKQSGLSKPFLHSTQHIKFVQISVKVTLLSVTSLLSSLILITFRGISYFYTYETPLDKCQSIWLQMDTIISCLCLVLFLPKTRKGFYLFCCCCNKLLSKVMKKSLYNSTVAMNN